MQWVVDKGKPDAKIAVWIPNLSMKCSLCIQIKNMDGWEGDVDVDVAGAGVCTLCEQGTKGYCTHSAVRFMS